MADESGVDVEKLQESIKRLEANNSELKKERNKFKEAAEKFNGVDIEALQSAADKLSKLEQEKMEQDGEYKKLYDSLQQQHAQDIANAKKAQADIQAKYEQTIKLNDLNNALIGVKVDPVLIEIASKSLINDIGLVEGKSMVGGKPVVDFVKEWAEGEVGKRFIPTGNSGGGSRGNESGGTQVEAGWFDPKSPEFNRTKQGQLRKTNPDLAAKLTERFAKRK